MDCILIQRFNAGDEAAFAEIVERYRGKIQSIATSYVRNHADAEEIAQDTFVRAHRGLATFRGESSLATWLHRIATNLSLNRYWHSFRRKRHLTFSLDLPLGADSSASFGDLVADSAPDAARRAVADEFVTLVAECMQRLAPDFLEILALRTQLHRSYGEIARTLGINKGTVKSRIARARGKLRDLMVEACPGFARGDAVSEWFGPLRNNVGMASAA